MAGIEMVAGAPSLSYNQAAFADNLFSRQSFRFGQIFDISAGET